MRNISVTLGLAILLLSTQSALSAQSSGPSFAGRGFGHGLDRGFDGGGFGMGHLVTGQPYSGVRTSTFVETLANGSTITHTTTTNEARDSSGRNYRATQHGSEPDAGSARTEYTVFDPVNRTMTNWRSGSTQAFLLHLPSRAAGGGSNDGANSHPHPDWHGAANGGDPATDSFHHHGPAPTVSQLGAKSFDGVDATGTRTSVTFPAGSFGNNQAITVTHERWVSEELGLTVLEIDNDPRNGVRTTTLTNIQRSEPDASLFQPPQGYTVTERTGGHRF